MYINLHINQDLSSKTYFYFIKQVSILTLYIYQQLFLYLFFYFFLIFFYLQNVYDEHSRTRCIHCKKLKYCWQINSFTHLYFLWFVNYNVHQTFKKFQNNDFYLEDTTSFDIYIAICVINKCNIEPHLFAFWYLRRIRMFVLYLVPIYSIC